MTSANITHVPVPIVTTFSTASGQVGYIQFNDHIATAETPLRNAITLLDNANVTDLILDLRYNGGGYLDLASELAYMIGNTTLTAGRTFEKIVFNDKNPSRNPVTGETPDAHAVPHDDAGLRRRRRGQPPLPTLEPQQRVHHHRSRHLLGQRIRSSMPARRERGTCTSSAPPPAASRMGSIRPTTAGLPTSPSSSVARTPPTSATTPMASRRRTRRASAEPSVPGCSVADDFTHALGDPTEGAHRGRAEFPRQQQPDVPRGQVIRSRACPSPRSNSEDASLVVSKPAARLNRIVRN